MHAPDSRFTAVVIGGLTNLILSLGRPHIIKHPPGRTISTLVPFSSTLHFLLYSSCSRSRCSKAMELVL